MPKEIKAYNVHDLRDLAKCRLPKVVFEFIDRGSEDDAAIRNNRQGFDRLKLVPRVLRDVSKRNPETSLFGQKLAMPLAVAPTGSAGLVWYEGEVAMARAAAKANVPFTIATGSLSAMEKIAEKAGGTLWYQYFCWKDKTLGYQQIERVKAAGIAAMIVTVDTPASPNREYNKRNGYEAPFRLSLPVMLNGLRYPNWLYNVMFRYLRTTGMPRKENFPPQFRDKITAAAADPVATSDAVTWGDLKEIRQRWDHPLMIKGILHPEDAIKSIECGVDAIIVSNHGGRNLDASIAPIDALPAIVDAMAGRVPVLVDSGVRRGSDIMKALALGAHAVLVGRAPVYGVTIAGEAGAALALAMLKKEFGQMMAMMGCATIADIKRDMVV